MIVPALCRWWMARALINIVKNAIEASPSGGWVDFGTNR